MLSILIIGLFVVMPSKFPVMIAASKLGAQKTGLLDCIIAIVEGRKNNFLFYKRDNNF
ncbi:hypothetical protein MNBD_GAMMA22-2584 [hydrothermal vent metagenome]|uniref:Uncharacterized protein n=1 Tax=hydrothermal vent metagenome TaxID=652676 RepID=A0A3B1ARE9_9ZZZZ